MSYFNEDQQAHMKSLATVPRHLKCNSGWHVVASEQCDCGPYLPCVFDDTCLRGRHRDSDRYCYEHQVEVNQSK